MNIRFVVAISALLLLVANTALVISEMPSCPINEDGESDGLEGVPGRVLCPTPDDYDCDVGSMEWEITGKQWIIQTSTSGRFVASSEGARYPMVPGHDEPSWKIKEVNIIAETGALCGGRQYRPLMGDFRPERSDNKNDFVMQDRDEYCYDTDNCNWIVRGAIFGWELRGDEYFEVQISNRCCELSYLQPTATNRIWVRCTEVDEEDTEDGG